MRGNTEQGKSGRHSDPGRCFWIGLICGGMTLAGGLGYLAGLTRRDSSVVMAVQQLAPFEFYLSEQSFSEVANTRSKLQALSTQFVTELRVRHHASASGVPAERITGNPLYVVEPGRAINEVEKAIEEFKGTGEEPALVQELLCLLKVQNLDDRWLDVYLNALYQRPADLLVARNAGLAAAVSKTLGREKEVVNAFDFLTRIPWDIPAKEQARRLAGTGASTLTETSALMTPSDAAGVAF